MENIDALNSEDMLKFMMQSSRQKPTFSNSLLEYDEVTLQVSKKLKDYIQSEMDIESELESSIIDIKELSGHYFHMIVANWKFICFKNTSSICEIMVLYKTITSLVHMFDGLKDNIQGLKFTCSIKDVKVHVSSTQKWMIWFMNYLEQYLKEYMKSTLKNFSDFPDKIYTSLYLFDYSACQLINL